MPIGEKRQRGSFACDQCNYRKIRCLPSDGKDDACRGCEKASLECTRCRVGKTKQLLIPEVVHRKGPKWKTANPTIQIIPPVAPSSNGEDRPVDPRSSWTDPGSDGLLNSLLLGDVQPGTNDDPFNALDYTSFLWGDPFSLEPGPFSDLDESTDSAIPDDLLPPGAECIVGAATCIQSEQDIINSMRHTIPDAHILLLTRSYCRRWGAYIVVLNYSSLLAAATRNDHHRSIQFRALLFTTLSIGVQRDFMSTGERDECAAELLEEAKRAIALSELEGPCVAHLVSSVFMFVLLEWLSDSARSWKYLQRAITMAQDLKMHQWVGKDLLDEENRVFLSTRYRIYIILCLIERSHALLGFSRETSVQSIRLDGHYWSASASYRASLPEGALLGVHNRHIALADLVDHQFIECYRHTCGSHCSHLTASRVEAIHDALEHLSLIPVSLPKSLEGIPGHSLQDVTRGNAAQTALWLQSVVYVMSRNHGLLSESAPRTLRPMFILDLLEKLVTLPTLIDSFKFDLTRDSAPKLLQICQTVVEYLKGMEAGERHRGTTLLFKATGVLLGNASDRAMTTDVQSANAEAGSELVKLVATIC